MMAKTLSQRSDQLLEAARKPHRGVFLTGPNRIEILTDELPESSFAGKEFLLASLGNCRCASDAKAIRQFDAHARVPSGADRIALGHETLQIVLRVPEGSKVKVGDLVVITLVMPVNLSIHLLFNPFPMAFLRLWDIHIDTSED